MMKTICRLFTVALLGGAALAANAQPAGASSTLELRGLTASQLALPAGEMPGYPNLAADSGSASPAQRGVQDTRMLGEMADHPHLPATPGRSGPLGQDRQDPRMNGEMGDHPHGGAVS